MAGLWKSYLLPPRQGPRSTDKNMIRVRGDWAQSSAGFNLFLEYRSVPVVIHIHCPSSIYRVTAS